MLFPVTRVQLSGLKAVRKQLLPVQNLATGPTRTRNLRLTAIRSLFTYAALRHPEHAANTEPSPSSQPPRPVDPAGQAAEPSFGVYHDCSVFTTMRRVGLSLHCER